MDFEENSTQITNQVESFPNCYGILSKNRFFNLFSQISQSKGIDIFCQTSRLKNPKFD